MEFFLRCIFLFVLVLSFIYITEEARCKRILSTTNQEASSTTPIIIKVASINDETMENSFFLDTVIENGINNILGNINQHGNPPVYKRDKKSRTHLKMELKTMIEDVDNSTRITHFSEEDQRNILSNEILIIKNMDNTSSAVFTNTASDKISNAPLNSTYLINMNNKQQNESSFEYNEKNKHTYGHPVNVSYNNTMNNMLLPQFKINKSIILAVDDINDTVIQTTQTEFNDESSQNLYNITMYYNQTSGENITENINPSVKTLVKYSCSAYKDVYKPHFLKPAESLNLDIDKQGMINRIYNYSPLFNNIFSLDGIIKGNDDKNIKIMVEGYKKPYNHNIKDIFYNFEHILSHLLKKSFGIKVEALDDNANLVHNIEATLSSFYRYIAKFFFVHPEDSKDIEFVVFNILIPYRNKIECMANHTQKLEFCRKCIGISDILGCCSIQIYNDEHKLKGQKFLKKAAKELKKQLKEYIASINTTNSQNPNDCFFDKTTIHLCNNFYSEFEKNNKIY